MKQINYETNEEIAEDNHLMEDHTQIIQELDKAQNAPTSTSPTKDEQTPQTCLNTCQHARDSCITMFLACLFVVFIVLVEHYQLFN